jgi:hypothetical protein
MEIRQEKEREIERDNTQKNSKIPGNGSKHQTNEK